MTREPRLPLFGGFVAAARGLFPRARRGGAPRRLLISLPAGAARHDAAALVLALPLLGQGDGGFLGLGHRPDRAHPHGRRPDQAGLGGAAAQPAGRASCWRMAARCIDSVVICKFLDRSGGAPPRLFPAAAWADRDSLRRQAPFPCPGAASWAGPRPTSASSTISRPSWVRCWRRWRPRRPRARPGPLDMGRVAIGCALSLSRLPPLRGPAGGRHSAPPGGLAVGFSARARCRRPNT